MSTVYPDRERERPPLGIGTADPLDSATFILINAFKTCIPITFASALFTLIFIRLRDIKEDGLPEVFT